MDELDQLKMAHLQQSKEVAQLLIEIGNLRLKNIELTTLILNQEIEAKRAEGESGNNGCEK